MKTNLPFVMKKDELQEGVISNDASVIQHCGFCRYVSTHLDEEINLEHCLNKKSIDEINKYLVYLLCNTSKKIGNMDFLPTIILDEEYEMGCKTISYTDYKNPYDAIKNIWDNYNCFLISGETGIGKTVFLNKLIRELCLVSLRKADNLIVPIYVDCQEVTDSIANVEDWVTNKIGDEFPNINFKKMFSSRMYTSVIVLDSFNSIGNDCSGEREFRLKVNSLVKKMSEWTTGNPFIKFIISTENVSYLVGTDSCFKKAMDLAQLYLQPLEFPQVQHMIDKSSLSHTEKQELYEFVKQNQELPFLKLPFFVDRLIKSVRTIECLTGKASFVSYYVDLSMVDSAHPKKEICDFLETIASILANKKYLSIADIENVYKNSDQPIVELLEYCVNKVFLTRANGQFCFSHKTFFDYFLASYIKANISYPYTSLEEILLCDMRFQNNEVITYLFEMIDNQTFFLEWLLDKDVLYAAVCVVNGHSQSEHRELVISKLIQEISIVSSCYSDSDKKDMGIFLGLLGDKRILSSAVQDYIAPKLSGTKMKTGAYPAIYPVTNAEYACFLNDPSHTEPEFWKEAIEDNWFSSDSIFTSVYQHWKKVQHHLRDNPKYVENLCGYQNFDKKQCASLFYFLNLSENQLENMIRELYDHNAPVPIMWENPEYNNPSIPVVGVSVYEALAYCRWLSKKSNCSYRLMTNNEWEEAANATSRKYSYGNRPNHKLMNTIESSWGGILPVGIICENKTKEGVFDVTGNLFEWTSSRYPTGSPHIGLDTQYICKGGSWIQDETRAVSTYVGRGKCWVKNIDLGFRICKDD